MNPLTKKFVNFVLCIRNFFGGNVSKTFISLSLLFILFVSFGYSKTQLLDVNTKQNQTSIHFLLFDTSFNFQFNLQKNNFKVFENFVAVSDFSLTPPVPPNDNPASILFLYDLSIGNLTETEQNQTLATNLIKYLGKEFQKDEKALLGFEMENYLLCNYTTDLSKFNSALQLIQTKPSSNFDSAFFCFNFGALEFQKNAKYPPVVILILDKNRDFDVESIIQSATNKNIRIFVIMVNNKISDKLKDLARKTNGSYFEFYNATDSISIFKALSFIIHNGSPAIITWDNLPLCSKERNVEVIYKNQDTLRFSIVLENPNFPQISTVPPFLRFSSVIPGLSRDLDLIIIARNRDIQLDSIKLNDPHFQIVSGNLSSPIVLPKDSGYKLTIRFTPTDSSIVFDTLVIFSDACNIRKINITGGFPNKKPRERTLNLLSPRCNDKFFIGDTIRIRWEGLLPADVVQLQYSTDNGNTWDTLAFNVLGLEYRWWLNPAKFQESDSCLIRIIQIWPNNAGETIELRHPSSVNCTNFNRDASLVATATNHPDEFASVWNPGTGKKIFTLKGHRRQVNWVSFDNQDRYVLTASDDSTAILWDVKTGDSLFTFSGHNGKVTSANFSPDGNLIVTSGSDGKTYIWDLRKKKVLQTLSSGINPIYFANFLLDSNLVGYATYDGNIYIFDIQKNKIIKTFATKFSNNHIHHFSFHPAVNLLAAASHLGLIFIWDFDLTDTLNQKVFPRHILTHDSLSYPAINTAYFNSTGHWLITAGSDSKVFRWNPATGELIDSVAIGEHSNSVTSALFSFDDAMLLTSSWDSTVKIFNRTKLGLQIDTTDCTFSINKPNIATYDFNLGKVALGKSLDSLLNPIIVNKSNIPLNIKKIEVVGTNAQEFKILQTKEATKLNPGDSFFVLINFAPLDTGYRTSKIKFYYEGNYTEATLTGYGFIPPLRIQPNFIDLGNVEFGEYKDTLLSYNIQNLSSKNVIISSIKNLGPDSLNFSIIDGGNPDTLKPQGYHPMTIRFTPDTLASRNTIIEIKSNTEPSTSYIQIKGNGVFPIFDTLIIAVGNYLAKPGDILKIPIVLRKKHFASSISDYKGFAFDLTFNKTILQPLDTVFKSTILDNNRILKVKANYENPDDSILITLNFKVGLGNDSITPLIISNSYPLGKGKIVIYESSGSLKLTNLCNQGGVRLFEPDGKISINSIQPNPSNGLITIDLDIVENGKTKLELYDYSGSLRKTLLNQSIQSGKYLLNFDLSELPNGLYLLTLRTPSQILTKTLQIVK